MTDHPEDPFGLPPLKQPIAPLAKGGDLTQAIAHLRRALKKHNIDTQGVRITIDLPTEDAARGAYEFDPYTFSVTPVIGQEGWAGRMTVDTKILGIAITFRGRR